ncbi:hypothetical protein [Vibrio marisflavi]|uniref:Solute-binding protein family 3/N-terminal domain-containing protein n=1 Tax=Vibrio marisflavi CECT 7928 TaxID=634439 RepID=A0ABN8E0R6_9VIBR|nr:hypothetical protein [Vibrio marisflavi]CAH0536270.1 hypothetical protein VMF7928_00304 [Vibrio marisflavi CECT 7928]
MGNLLRSCLYSLLVTFSVTSVAAVDIIHPVPRDGSDLDKYAIDLISFLAKKSGQEVNVKPYDRPVDSQSRKVQLIKEGKMTVDWLGADKKVESQLVPIRYPIFRGLLGHRIFITNKTTEAKLGAVQTKAELEKFSMIQGEGWADVGVLKAGGFRVKEVPSFENIFKIVDAGRADLFPRAVIEPYSELAGRPQYKNLLVDDKLMLVYRFPMFLFVSPTAANKPVVDILNAGFEKAYQDGSFIEFFEKSPLVVKTFEQAKLKQRKVFNIPNPNLSEKTRSIPDKYWLKL